MRSRRFQEIPLRHPSPLPPPPVRLVSFPVQRRSTRAPFKKVLCSWYILMPLCLVAPDIPVFSFFFSLWSRPVRPVIIGSVVFVFSQLPHSDPLRSCWEPSFLFSCERQSHRSQHPFAIATIGLSGNSHNRHRVFSPLPLFMQVH